jgi:hypothetical protein
MWKSAAGVNSSLGGQTVVRINPLCNYTVTEMQIKAAEFTAFIC